MHQQPNRIIRSARFAPLGIILVGLWVPANAGTPDVDGAPGAVDQVKNGTISGWVSDSSRAKEPMTVLFYMNRPRGSPGTELFFQDKTFIHRHHWGDKKQYFETDLPEAFGDDRPHTVYAYVVLADNHAALLSGSPATFQFKTRPPVRLKILSVKSRRLDAGNKLAIRYKITGHRAKARHVHWRVGSSPEIMDLDAAGTFEISAVAPGDHTLHGYLARGHHEKILNTDVSVRFRVK